MIEKSFIEISVKLLQQGIAKIGFILYSITKKSNPAKYGLQRTSGLVHGTNLKPWLKLIGDAIPSFADAIKKTLLVCKMQQRLD